MDAQRKLHRASLLVTLNSCLVLFLAPLGLIEKAS